MTAKGGQKRLVLYLYLVFTVTYENETGVIKGNETYKVMINNHKEPEPVVPDEPVIPKKEENLEVYQPVKEAEMTVNMEKTVVDIESLKTGDTVNITPYIFAAVAAGIGVIALLVNSKRKHD